MTPAPGCCCVGRLVLLLLAWTAWTLTRLRRLEGRVTAPGPRWTPSCSVGPAWRRSWPATTRRAVGAARGGVPRRLRRRRPRAADGDRELAENVLGRELRELPRRAAGVPPALRTTCGAPPTRVGLARRFYNDAVRDTRDAAAPPAAPAAAAARLPRRCPGTSTSTTAWSRSPAGRAAPVDGRRDRPYDGRPYDLPSIQRQHPVASAVDSTPSTGTDRVKRGMAEQLKGGVIMDVVTPEQAKIAEDAGAVAVMALERVPADIRAQGGIARMSDPDMIDGHHRRGLHPGHGQGAHRPLRRGAGPAGLGVDYIDESEVLTPADEAHHIAKHAFTVPFVCGATDLGEALRRIAEGAAMIRSKGEAGTGNVVEATRHMRSIRAGIRRLGTLDETELFVAAKELRAPYDLVAEVAAAGQAAGRAVHRRRHRHPGRRRDDDAARRRGRVRRLGHLQVRRPGAARGRDRAGHHLPRRPRRDRQGLPRAGRGRWSASTSPRSPRASATRPAAGERRPVIGVLALQGDVREHLAALREQRRRGGAGAPARGARRGRRAGAPRRRVDHDGASSPPGSACSSRCGPRVRGGLPAYGSCAGMILLADRILDAAADQETIGGLDVTVRRNAFGRQVDSFESDLDVRRARRAAVHAVFIRAPVGRGGRPTASRSSAGSSGGAGRR